MSILDYIRRFTGLVVVISGPSELSLPCLSDVLLGRFYQHSVRSSRMRALQIMCWRLRLELSPTTWMCQQSAPGGSWGWMGPSRHFAIGWWWWSSTTGLAETWLSNVLRYVKLEGPVFIQCYGDKIDNLFTVSSKELLKAALH